jgi:MOSC domain-containing protein YiiM
VAAPAAGRILSLNVGRVVPVPWGSCKRSAIDKRPVPASEFRRLGALGVEGDEIADREHHGGADQAVYAFAREDLDRWERELGRPVTSGTFGENLTMGGVAIDAAVVGESWQLGDAVVQVTAPRIPCSVFAGFQGQKDLVKRFTAAGSPGAYLRVLKEGRVAAGDPVVVLERPAHGITLNEVFRARTGDADLIPRALAAPELSGPLRRWLEQRLAR